MRLSPEWVVVGFCDTVHQAKGPLGSSAGGGRGGEGGPDLSLVLVGELVFSVQRESWHLA